MHVKIPMRPWKESWECSLEEASILTVSDRFHEASPLFPVHVIEIGEVEILCHGFTMEVPPQGAFLTFAAHNVHEKSWDDFFEKYSFDECLEGSGCKWGYTPKNEELIDLLKWWPGCDLIVAPTSLTLEPLPKMELVDK